MEGYLWKKGHTIPTMNRRFCVLKGTLFAYYLTEQEYRSRQKPRKVLEIIQIQDLAHSPSKISFHHAHNGFVVEYLGAKQYHLVADSKETKATWLSALQFALDEPDRIAQEEIEQAQQLVRSDKQQVQISLQQAKELVNQAQQATQQTKDLESQLVVLRHQLEQLQQQTLVTQIRYEEACKRTREAQAVLERTHARPFSSSPSKDVTGQAQNPPQDRVALLEAQHQVELTYEETCRKELEEIQRQMAQNQQDQARITVQANDSAQQAKRLREAAAKSIQQAQFAKQQITERVQSWKTSSTLSPSASSPTTSISQLDPLAEGYLLARMNTRKTSLQRFYFVLYGSTLCWFKDADEYNKKVDLPYGYLHISGLSEWDGRLGSKDFPHAFSMLTFEGQTLLCSAPIAQSATTWKTALHMAMAMPPLSPHRAIRARMKRSAANIDATFATISAESGPVSSPNLLSKPMVQAKQQVATDEEEKLQVIEGYLVKKSQLVPVMVKKYAVLKGLDLSFYDSHDAFALECTESVNATTGASTVVVQVDEWDGSAPLMHYKHGFQLTTAKREQIYCSAPNESEKRKWLDGIQLALAKYKQQMLSPSRQEDLLLAKACASASISPSSSNSAPSPMESELSQLDHEFSAMGCSEKASERRFEFLKTRLVELLQAFYQRHNASKLASVQELVTHSFGAQQEGHLIQEIDRVYDTCLFNDPDMQRVLNLLTRLRHSPNPTKALSEFVCMEGYLKHAVVTLNESPHGRKDSMDNTATRELIANLDNLTRAFFVLRANKLLCYESRLEYESKPHEVHQSWLISQVVQTPEGELKPSTNGQFECVGVVQQGSRASDKPNQHQHLIFIASNDKEQILWVTRMRSGLGFALAHDQDESNSPLYGSGPAATLSRTPSSSQATKQAAAMLRERLLEFYKQYNPSKVLEVDTLLNLFDGNYQDLLTRLDSVYKTRLSSDKELHRLCLEANGMSTHTQSGLVHHLESYLYVNLAIIVQEKKRAVSGPAGEAPASSAFRRVYGVLHGDALSLHESFSAVVHEHEGHHASVTGLVGRSPSRKPLWEDTVVNVSLLNDKLKQLHAFCIETHQFGVFLARAESSELMEEWIRVLRTVVDEKAHARRMQLTASAGTSGTEAHPLYAVLVEYYKTHNPSKVDEVGTLLEAFAGQEMNLLKEIDVIYHTHLVDQPVVQAILQQIDRQDAPTHIDVDASAPASQASAEPSILMEGYLLKRGHNIPSMRKRYCVLCNSELLYFATQQDSKDHAKAYGRFKVVIVSEWHGNTTTHHYPNGIEVETDDGKTFFISAVSPEDKQKWLLAFRTAIAMAHKSTRANVLSRPYPEPMGTTLDLSSDVKQDAQAPLRERLLAFYRVQNPTRIKDVDFLLEFYRNREMMLLKALDETYGTNLADDDSTTKLVPVPSPSLLINEPGRRASNNTIKSLQTLRFDGSLLRSIGNASFRHPHQVYARVDGVRMTFHASREGFKSASVDDASAGTSTGQSNSLFARSNLSFRDFSNVNNQHSDVMIIALKRLDLSLPADNHNDSTPNRSPPRENSFGVETSDHTWMYFQAPTRKEFTIWIEVLQVAIDCQLGREVLEGQVVCASELETEGLVVGGGLSPQGVDGSSIAMHGILTFLTQELLASSPSSHNRFKETFCVLFGESNELFVFESNEQESILRFLQSSASSGSTSPESVVTAAKSAPGFLKSFSVMSTRKWDNAPSECRFGFQLASLEVANGTNCILSVNAASDLDKAKWLRRLRLGIRRAQAEELLKEQAAEAHMAQQQQQHAIQEAGVGGRQENLSTEVDKTQRDVEIKVPDTLAADASTVQIKGYLMVRLGNNASSSSPHHLLKDITESNKSQEVYVVVQKDAQIMLYPDDTSYGNHHDGDQNGVLFHSTLVKCSPTSSPLDIEVETTDATNPVVFLTCPTSVDKTKWIQLLLRAIRTNQAQQLLDDEQQVLALDLESNPKRTHDELGSLQQLSQPLLNELSSSAYWTPKQFVVPGSSMEGPLRKCNVFFGHHTNELYFVLMKSHLLAFNSQQEALAMASHVNLTQTMEELDGSQTPSTTPLSPRTDLMNRLMEQFFNSSEAMEILSVSEWTPIKVPFSKGSDLDRPDSQAQDNAGFKVEVHIAGHDGASLTTKDTVYLVASCAEERDVWIKATQREVEYSVVEKLLQVQTQQFRDQVITNRQYSQVPIAPIGTGDTSSEPVPTGSALTSRNTMSTGSLAGEQLPVTKPCVSFKGSLWYRGHTLKLKLSFKERFCVLHDLNLMIFMTKQEFDIGWSSCGSNESDIGLDSNAMLHDSGVCNSLQTLKSHAHKIVVVANVSEWSSAEILKSKRFGFRLETTRGQLIEFCVASVHERDNWVLRLQQAVRNSLAMRTATSLAANIPTSHMPASPQFMRRDASLPTIPDATLEGFLRVDQEANPASASSLLIPDLSSTRYVVLRGVTLMVYGSQTDALDQQKSPAGVYEVDHVSHWMRKADSGQGQQIKRKGFLIHVKNGEPTSTAVADTSLRVLKCRAQSSLEKLQWMQTIDQQRLALTQASEQLVLAVQKHQDKSKFQLEIKNKLEEVAGDARRRSMLLRQCLNDAMLHEDSDEEGSYDDDDSDLDDGEEVKLPVGGTPPPQHQHGENDSPARVDFIDMNPENSPMQRQSQTGQLVRPFSIAPQDSTMDGASGKLEATAKSESFSTWMSSFWDFSPWNNCFCTCLSAPRGVQPTISTIAPFPLDDSSEYQYEYFYQVLEDHQPPLK